ncbi:GNAT family N-acetyltransferase [Ferrimonas sp. SCSIO 43195]|uniref:GNAT family N-acetyltransferase n=1 Tax=Ferrimonas sp. SCSIO 43195 TaxID=2822844 RepID=UPI002075B0E6|nr:GNAT family N-acetyltransferase [Ferrimonas sp. SCSIO 43195]USD38667.1 GNAT family N-acetyltransferase [Ferrimonas sp. SCSIO 43195]
MIELVSFSESLNKDWDLVVSKSKNGNFLHLVDYWTYHYDRFEDHSLIIYIKNKPVAVFPACKVDNTIVSHQGLTYSGLIYGNDLKVEMVEDIMSSIVSKYREEGINRILYKAIPYIFHKYPSQEDLYAIYKLGFKLYRRDVSTVIDFREDLPKTSSLRKRSVKKAIKSGVTIEESSDFEGYHLLLTEVLSKFKASPVHSVDELELLHSRFKEKIKLYVAKHDEKLVAGTIVYELGDVAHTQYLASSELGREVGALDMILMHLIEKVYSDRKYFSFGISTEDNGMFLNKGLISQKEGFGGRAVCHDFYELVLQDG